MKKLVGTRENVDTDQKAAVALAMMFTSPNRPKPIKMELNETCAQCKASVKITLSEDIDTGEIWLEGPDKCEECDHQLSDEEVVVQMLSQEAIERLFGKY